MTEIKDKPMYIYDKYINMVLNKHAEGLIYSEELVQYLDTLTLWETKARKMTANKQEVLLRALEEV